MMAGFGVVFALAQRAFLFVLLIYACQPCRSSLYWGAGGWLVGAR